MSELKDCYKYKGDIEWTVPGLFIYDASWVKMYKVFLDGNIKFPKVNYYGAPRSAWTAGRGSWVRHELPEKVVRRVLQYIKTTGSTPTYTFSRYKMSSELIQDKYANMLLDVGIEEGARYIVASDLLKDHIKNKNPDSIVVSSILRPIFEFQQPNNVGRIPFEQETQFYNELLKEYDVVVVRPEYSLQINKNNCHLIADISRIEVLINQICQKDCPAAIVHYSDMENHELIEDLSGKNLFNCVMREFPMSELINRNVIHDKQKIQELLDCGVKRLKIHGRAVGLNNFAQPYIILREIWESDSQEMSILYQALANEISVSNEYKYFDDYLSST